MLQILPMLETTPKKRGRPPLDAAASNITAQEKLIQAAVRQFSLHGFGSTTVRALADEAGVNVSLVSYYFGSKEGLYQSAISQFGDQRLAAARKVLTPQADFEGVRLQLQKFLGELFACYVESPDLVRLIYREADSCSPLIQEVFRETFFEIYKTLVSFLKSARERGILGADFDPQIAASMILSAYSQAVRGDEMAKELLGLSLFNSAYRRRLKKQIVSTILFGLKGPWPTPKGEA